ncbi:hypothetical protein Tco_0199289 [Tanacetum coccineum]
MLKTVGSKRKFEDDTYEDNVTSTFSKGKKKKKCKSSSKKNDGKKRKVKDKVRKSIRTRTTPTSLFSAMCILNPDRKKCIRDMGFGSMIGMIIYDELFDALCQHNGDLYNELFEREASKWGQSNQHPSQGPLTFMILLYLHSTRCDHFDVIRQTPAIRYWKSGQMTYREKLEIEEYGGFGRLPKHEAIKLQSEDFVKMIEDKLYNIRQDVIVEVYDDMTMIFTTGVNKDKNELPNCDSQIEEDGTENVDTTGKDNESDSPALSDGDNQKNDFRVMFHKKCGNFFKNKESSSQDFVYPSLNEDDKVGDSSDATGVDSVIQGGDAAIETENVDINEKVENKKQKNSNEESSSQDSVNPSLNEDDKVGDSSHATVVDSVIEVDAATEEAEDVDMNENVENEKKKNGNEESSSQDFVHPSLNEDDKVGDSSHATGVDSVIQGGDAAIETENVDINEKVENKKQKNSNEESSSQDFVYPSLNEDDKVGDSSHATCVDSVIGEDVDSQQTLEDNFKGSEDKFSRHLIIRLPEMAFKDNRNVGAFVNQICSRIHCARGRDENFQQLFISKDSSSADVPGYLFIDTAVYSRNRCIRLHLSSKAGKNSVLLPTERFKCKKMSEEDVFMVSLICNMDIDFIKFLIMTPRNSRRIQKFLPMDGYVSRKSVFPKIDELIEYISSIGDVKGKIRSWYWFSDYDLLYNEVCDEDDDLVDDRRSNCLRN